MAATSYLFRDSETGLVKFGSMKFVNESPVISNENVVENGKYRVYWNIDAQGETWVGLKNLEDSGFAFGKFKLSEVSKDVIGTVYASLAEFKTATASIGEKNVGVVGGCLAVTPHDTNLLPHIGWIEVRGNAGNVAIVDAFGNASLVLAFDTKETSKMLVSQVLATGTTATDIYLYY